MFHSAFIEDKPPAAATTALAMVPMTPMGAGCDFQALAEMQKWTTWTTKQCDRGVQDVDLLKKKLTELELEHASDLVKMAVDLYRKGKGASSVGTFGGSHHHTLPTAPMDKGVVGVMNKGVVGVKGGIEDAPLSTMSRLSVYGKLSEFCESLTVLYKFDPRIVALGKRLGEEVRIMAETGCLTSLPSLPSMSSRTVVTTAAASTAPKDGGGSKRKRKLDDDEKRNQDPTERREKKGKKEKKEGGATTAAVTGATGVTTQESQEEDVICLGDYSATAVARSSGSSSGSLEGKEEKKAKKKSRNKTLIPKQTFGFVVTPTVPSASTALNTKAPAAPAAAALEFKIKPKQAGYIGVFVCWIKDKEINLDTCIWYPLREGGSVKVEVPEDKFRCRLIHMFQLTALAPLVPCDIWTKDKVDSKSASGGAGSFDAGAAGAAGSLSFLDIKSFTEDFHNVGICCSDEFDAKSIFGGAGLNRTEEFQAIETSYTKKEVAAAGHGMGAGVGVATNVGASDWFPAVKTYTFLKNATFATNVGAKFKTTEDKHRKFRQACLTLLNKIKGKGATPPLDPLKGAPPPSLQSAPAAKGKGAGGSAPFASEHPQAEAKALDALNQEAMDMRVAISRSKVPSTPGV